jgi:nucleotide-binding universal stress UspA family protein
MYQRILVPIDGSATSNRGLEEAIRLARLTGGHVRLMHVIDNLSITMGIDAYSGWSQEMFDGLRAAGAEIIEAGRAKVVAGGVTVETVLHDNFEGPVHELVIAEAQSWKADLIVLGTHGRSGVGRMFLGSSAEYILRIAPIPVLLVRAPKMAAPEKAPEKAPEAVPITVNLPRAALAFE